MEQVRSLRNRKAAQPSWRLPDARPGFTRSPVVRVPAVGTFGREGASRPAEAQAEFGRGSDFDFSSVRVHGDQAAADATRLRPSGSPGGAASAWARPSAVPARPGLDVLRGSGQPLAPPLREEMEARLGADFSEVRVHTDGTAGASAADFGARAYTFGDHVVIGEDGADKHVLAHELTHVIQQRQGPVAGTDDGSGLKVSDPSDRDELAAEANAARVMRVPQSEFPPVRAGTREQGIGAGNHAVQAVLQRKREAGKFTGTFNANEVREILDSSEGRNGSTGAAGHPRQHVSDAAGTRDYAKQGHRTKTCFVNDAQQNQATTAALNTGYGQGQLGQLDAGTVRVSISDASVGGNFNAWQSEWDPGTNDAKPAKRIRISKMTVVVDGRAGSPVANLAAPEIHIQTAYPQDG